MSRQAASDHLCKVEVGAIARALITHRVLIAPGEIRRRTSARRVFPFSFSQQSVTLPRALAQPLHICLGVVPIHVDHRPIAPAPTAIARPVAVAAACRDARIPLRERHLVTADFKIPPRNAHHFRRRDRSGRLIILVRVRARINRVVWRHARDLLKRSER